MNHVVAVILSLCLFLSFATGCNGPKKMTEVKPEGMTMLNNFILDTLGNDEYSGYIGVKIKVGDADLKVTMLGRIGKHMRNDHNLIILDETKAVVASAKLTRYPDAYFKDVAYAKISAPNETFLSANSVYYILSKEENGDFWYGEKTSTSQNPYFSIEGVVMSEDAYDIAFMKDTKNRVLGPVDFVFTVVEVVE